MTESVIRHRGVKRDEDGKITEPSAPDVTLSAIGVAPGMAAGSTQAPRLDRGRDGEDITCTVFFDSPIPVLDEDGRVSGYTDIVNGDELTVRGDRFRIIVNDWSLEGMGGLEVLCVRGQG